MLEGLAAWVLNNYLGKYVENLNTDQLSIALLSGKVELENLPLKRDALRQLGLPVQIREGFIGKISLQIPVRQIRSAPWVIAIEQLYLVATPLPVYEWDAVAEELIRQEQKLTALDTIEARWRLETESRDSSTYYASSYSSWLSFGTGVVSNIVENLQLKIQDVHIRYEDDISIPGKNVGIGVTIESLSAQSCDSNWVPGFSHLDKEEMSFKILEMQKFAIYCIQLEQTELLSKLPLGGLAVSMSPNQVSEVPRNYILPPVSAQAHLKRNLSEKPLRSPDDPRIVCNLTLEEVPITLIDWQYDQLVKSVSGLDDIARLRRYRRFRPITSIKEDARAWWLYAISCFYPGGQPEICKNRPTWDSCLEKAKQNVQYVKMYRKILITPTLVLTSDEKKVKDEVEWDREFEDLKTLRDIAMRTVTLPNRKNNNNSTGRSMLESWFPQWMGWYSSAPEANTSPEATQLEGEILQVLSDSVDNNTLLRRDVVFGQFNFCLKRGCLFLSTVQQDTCDIASMLELEFKNLTLNIVSKPRTSSHLIELTLGDLSLKDKITLNTLFPVLMGPPGLERATIGRSRILSPRVSVVNKLEEANDPLFYLGYEKKPQHPQCDYRLCIRSKCLDVVYQPNAIKWLTEFLCLPHQRKITQSRIEAMKTRTKKELIKNWEQILDGRKATRTTWDLELDISAPQIIFVERFSDLSSAMAVIDFGRLQLRNNLENIFSKADVSVKESEDDETFLTPCSTPPQSEASISEDATLALPSTADLPNDLLDESCIHQKLYDRYVVELTDLQLLVGKVKDNWRYAHNKGSSTLHVLDRFNISFQIEHRILPTSDPLYPSLTLSANLPKLVAHLNETKINSARCLIHIITSTGLPSPFKGSEDSIEIVPDTRQTDEQTISENTSMEMSRLLMVQFTVDQMSLEVQSRGRSVAELQVAGVKAAFTKRPVDMNITLTVHSLLLVDALQTFGPDFELLVASHKHVGMDSMSGSLRDSEPTSPVSPASPDPNVARTIATSPVALTQALSTLATSPTSRWEGITRPSTVLDAEALISIEVVFVTGQEPMQIANIQFNNLDIIANQETIVELVGFLRRVFPTSQKPQNISLSKLIPSSVQDSSESLLEDGICNLGRTDVTFDFHRLNVLLLRGVIRDGILQGKKICTATMSEAKIQASVESAIEIKGSLGGLQVVDLTPEGHIHQKIVSVGKDPLLEENHNMYTMSIHQEKEETAFSFQVVRNLHETLKGCAEVQIKMASLWYTHSTHFVNELQSCATEFKQYMANLARSIRTAATDMALGLVHARAEALAQSLYMNARLSSSIYGSSLSFSSECGSPRRRRRSSSMESSGFTSAKDTVPQTPYSPGDEDDFVIDLKLDIELDSPVVILPRASNSPEVFIAHLGKINVTNKHENVTIRNDHFDDYSPEARIENYDVEVRDMNLYSLDISSRRIPGPMTTKIEVLYSCETLAKPILHDTVIQLGIEREIYRSVVGRNSSESNLLLDDIDTSVNQDISENIQISGSVVTALKVSLTRAQYEQVLDTLQWLTSSAKSFESDMAHQPTFKSQSALGDISEEDTGVTTLNMDPHVRAKLFPVVTNYPKSKEVPKSLVAFKVAFELPIFTVELRGDSPMGEVGLVDLSFRDFVFNYEKFHRYETNIQVSLRSIYMEDLLQPDGSKQRAMVVSSAGTDPPINSTCVSRSCPDVPNHPRLFSPSRGSLPEYLEPSKVFGMAQCLNSIRSSNNSDANDPCTPPPSPSQGKCKSERNLVLISTLLVDPEAPNFNTYYNGVQRSTSVDFNCLDLVVSVESWVVVIDFFSASPGSSVSSHISSPSTESKNQANMDFNAETNITIRSLTMMLVKPDRDVAKANISNVDISVKTTGLDKEVEGKLGSMSLLDLTLHGHLYRERFLTSGKQALQFKYIRSSPSEFDNFDAQLRLEMASVTYIHTKRFVAELQSFFNHFTQLQAVMKSIRAATSGQKIRDEPFRLALYLKAGSPIILLPVSSRSSDLLVADFGELLVQNTFKLAGDEGTISIVSKQSSNKCLLDVMTIDLQNMDLYTAVKENEISKHSESFLLGNSQIRRKGLSLLTKKFQLKLQVERNLHNNMCHSVPDMSIYGQLSTLDASLILSQYRLIRGLLSFNLGEDTEHILPSVTPPSVNADANIQDVWTLNSLRFDLQNVTLRLQKCHDSPPLTCINFIKSRLTIETFSNLSQDIDLVSQEILVMDTRFHGSCGEQENIFTNILQPINVSKEDDLVQAEIHSRRKVDYTKFTILLNNMRLMAVFSWWEAVQEYIFQEIENVSASPDHHKSAFMQKENPSSFELKLNITDSEIVVVENTSQWDTNAVILKSTTVLNYRPKNKEKPLSCSLNNCEMFSCILGMEEETALSIIDPITLNIDISGAKKLEAQLQYLTIRLSYHDMKMFLRILNSLPKQMFSQKENSTAAKPVLCKANIDKLMNLGFQTDDCINALEHCDGKLDDAALWLTQNASPHAVGISNNSPLNIKSIEIKANCIAINIIDDCGDSDVPLLELSFRELVFLQILPELDLKDPVYPQGSLNCFLTSDYYNRVLSGWEPLLEPWSCNVNWEKALSADLLRNRLNVNIDSKEVLNLNCTSTVLELYKQVKENWTKDYYNMDMTQNKNAAPGFRQRSPFVPFEIKNDTGSPLYFITLITDLNQPHESMHLKPSEEWILVEPGQTLPFSFRTRDKLRHHDSHKMKLHQLAVRVEGWQTSSPVTVDKVGVYFRHASVQIHNRQINGDIPPARIVFDISLVGSAKKLVTIRSALVIENKLPQAIDVKLESQLPHEYVTSWVPSKSVIIDPNCCLSVPLVHAYSQINVRPCGESHTYIYCSPSLSWLQMPSNLDVLNEIRTCHTHKGPTYRFCANITREKHFSDRQICLNQPAHRITLLPTVKIINLLPIDLIYTITAEKGRISAGNHISLTKVDPYEVVELDISVENFNSANSIIIPAVCAADFTCRIRLEDDRGRKLYLQAVISVNRGAKLRISISAPFWIINKTGLPLVFRQAGTSTDAAGQFEEHELARLVTPLLFSFSDQDASPSVNARVGHYVIRDGSPQWCSNFHLQKGTQVRKLRVTMKDGRPDTVFVVGIEVRQGRGKYRTTNIVTVSPRYQLHNKSSYQLRFAQSCITKMDNQKSQNTCLRAMPNSHMPFHWPRLDQEQLLCVAIEDVPDCCWSGGLPIDKNNSMHVNVRDINGRVYFLRLEVVLQGATVFIVFTDADTMPPPLRVDNFSEVSITFAQHSYKEFQHCTARAHSSVPYAWDQPTKPSLLTVMAPGGVSNTYDMNKLGSMPGLTYENFIYIAFTGTFKSGQDILGPLDVGGQELVLDVVNKSQVVLAKKRHGQRSQLWRMTTEGYLHHEGSSPPSHPNQPRLANILVLDIDNTAPQPNTFSRLTLRKIDPRRRSTQTWRFTDEGRLCCAHYNMCVQAQDGFFGLRQGQHREALGHWQQWNAAVLGMASENGNTFTETGVPIEQAVTRQRLRPGSGYLAVSISMDGPTRVLVVKDIKEKHLYATPDEREWRSIALQQRPNFAPETEEVDKNAREVQITVRVKGLGVSVVCKKTPEELLYALFCNIVGETVFTNTEKRLCISIGNIQVDNQLFDAPVPVVLYVTPMRDTEEIQDKLPAIDFSAEVQQKVNKNAVIFKYFVLRLKKITVIIEEKLLLKFSAFVGFHSKEEELVSRDENDYETQRMLAEVSATHAKRYYFGRIQLVPDQITLSVATVNKLPTDLRRIKKKLGLTLIKFEDAKVDLQAFDRRHPFETWQCLVMSIVKHFKDELLWQAGIIMGSFDIFGNPVGLYTDVSEGVQGFIREGNIGGLFKNVTHGLSNTAAKFTESISDGLGKVSMDDHHEETRQRIRQVETGKGKDHLVAGLKGLGFGFLGGATSMFKQIYEGAANDGIQGVFSGVGKGLVGTITKPVVGILDFTSETARAIRDSSSSKLTPERNRLPRCVHGPGGLLPRYSSKQSVGQQYLYIVNNKNYSEKLIAFEVLGSASEDLQCIASDEKIRIVANTQGPDLTPIIDCSLQDLETCNVIAEDDGSSSQPRYYIEIVMHVLGSSSSAAIVNSDPVRKPRVRCRSAELAKTVAQQINYAKRLYIEHLYTFRVDNNSNIED